MNTKSNFDRRLVLITGVLLMTIWLPLTTFAQDSSKNTHSQILRDCEKFTEILTASTAPNTRTVEKEVGFSETAPADKQSENIETVTRTFIVRAHVNVGFSETDPADQQSKNIEVVTRTSVVRAGVDVGFSETDPGDNMFKSVGETNHQTLADCSAEKAKDMILGTLNFSSLTVEGDHHDYG